MLGSVTMGSTTEGSLVPPLAGELPLAGDRSLAGERSLVGELPLGGVVETDRTSGTAFGCSWWACPAPTQVSQQSRC